MTLRLAIVEDDARLRQQLTDLLATAPNFKLLAAFANAESALDEIPALAPDIAVLDINLPRMSGVQLVARLKPLLPRTQFLMLTMFEDSEMIFDSLKAGASGYLLKRTPPGELLQAIEQLHAGGSPMSPEIARQVVGFFQRASAAPDMESLTPRELEILDQLAKGYLYKEIADRLSISLDTVRNHLRKVYGKLHVHSRTGAVLKYLGNR
ncbi:MAG: response regulator transcription factor [Verrucomicrobia bacterium]|nr:response regulator transcription factor [Verrucomicrobiota bacterium]